MPDEIGRVSSHTLMAEAASAQRIADELRKQARDTLRMEEQASRPQMPAVLDASVYLTFVKYTGGRNYHYAAVGWRHGESVRWAVTGQEDRRFNWNGLLLFIGKANWSTLHLVTASTPLITPEDEPAAAEEIGRYGRVERTVNVVSPLVETWHGKAYGTNY